MIGRIALAAGLGWAGMLVAFAAPLSAQSTVLILDASGSMWEELAGGYKIRMAQTALKSLGARLPDESRLALIAYGHRREDDCSDIETVVPLGRIDRAALNREIDALDPKGRTPITGAIQEAINTLRDQQGASSVVLVSDGLENCGGNPCQLVRDVRASGVGVVMHVIGFDVGEVDASQLECTAQAGGGRYLGARDAEELAEALVQAVEAPAFNGGYLSLTATRDGELLDVAITLDPVAGGEQISGGRTYRSAETNPRVVPVPEGRYTVNVVAVGLRGDVRTSLDDVTIVAGDTVRHALDFSAGEVGVRVTRNGALSDASVRVYQAGTQTEVAAGRTYVSESSNPRVFNLTTGTYDIWINPLELSGQEPARLEGISVGPGRRADVVHEFPSGTLRVQARNGDALQDATVNVVRAASNAAVAGGRTYTSANSNPRTFELAPGRYVVRVGAVRLEGSVPREFEVEITAGGVVEHVVDFRQR